MIYWCIGLEGDVVAVPVVTAAICGPQRTKSQLIVNIPRLRLL